MGGLPDLLSGHRSEYFQHDQRKTLNFSEMKSDTPLNHPWWVNWLYSWYYTRLCSHHSWIPWQLILNNNTMIQTWFSFRILAISLLIYSLLDVISEDRNCLFQPPPLGYLWKELDNPGWMLPKYHHFCGWIHTIEVHQTYYSGKYISHLRTSFGWITVCSTPDIE